MIPPSLLRLIRPTTSLWPSPHYLAQDHCTMLTAHNFDESKANVCICPLWFCRSILQTSFEPQTLALLSNTAKMAPFTNCILAGPPSETSAHSDGDVTTSLVVSGVSGVHANFKSPQKIQFSSDFGIERIVRTFL